MKIIKCKDYEEMSKKAFEIVKKEITENPKTNLCLPYGLTPLGLYKEMVSDYYTNHTSYQNVQFFNIDEFVPIAKNHPGSHYSYMKMNLLSFLNVPENHIHYPYGIDYLECIKYEKLLQEYPIDLQVLGIGRNAHIGYAEPGTQKDEPTHIVTLAPSSREGIKRFFHNDLEKVPRFAITMGIGTILQAKKILLLASGKNKAEAIQQMIENEPNPDCPASYLQEHPNVTVILDEEAASLLKK
ncbi:MAG: glucosamine-6-phosphate deaminase [Bacillota bacterium]|nr:glucosamine-6-phosphate deaminase [Bacillota bacterium]